MQRGPRRGAAPNSPPLPHAGKASKSPPGGEISCPKGRMERAVLRVKKQIWAGGDLDEVGGPVRPIYPNPTFAP